MDVIGMIQENITLVKLLAEEGKILTNGTSYGREIYFGAEDCVENWQEINAADYVQQNSDPSDDYTP